MKLKRTPAHGSAPLRVGVAPKLRKTIKKVLAATSTALLVASAVVLGVTAPASADATLVGEVGVMQDWTSESNKASYWNDRFDHPATCYKHEKSESTQHGSVTNSGKTVTLNPFNQSWPGDHWEALIIKGSSNSNNVVTHPEAGVAYASPANDNTQADVSHWIVCKGTTPAPPPVAPSVTFTDVCGTSGDGIVVGDNAAEVDYTVTDSRTDGVGVVTVTAVPQSGYTFKAGTYPADGWSHTFTSEDCVVGVFVVPDPVDQECSLEQLGATESGYIWVDLGGTLDNEISYQITGGPSSVDFTATSEFNNLEPGDYVVTVTEKPGYKLDDSMQSVWSFTINGAGTCSLETHPLISTTATSQDLTCSLAGSYTLAATEGVLWYVNGSATPTAPGTYPVSGATTVNVVAETTGPDFGWEFDAQTAWTFNFTNPVDCLPTLAFTGSDGGTLGLLLAGGFLLFGGTIVAFERRFRTNAR